MIAMACQSKKSSWRIQYTEFKAARTAARAQHSARNKYYLVCQEVILAKPYRIRICS